MYIEKWDKFTKVRNIIFVLFLLVCIGFACTATVEGAGYSSKEVVIFSKETLCILSICLSTIFISVVLVMFAVISNYLIGDTPNPPKMN